jgi:hypothetical protein
MTVYVRAATVVIAALCLAGCHELRSAQAPAPPIVGSWLVTIPEAPFPLHVFAFHSDGIVEQSNPDAGDAGTSDSNLIGAWQRNGDGYTGTLVEVTADRTTHQFAARGEISFVLKVSGNAFTGTASAKFVDSAGRLLRGPIQVAMKGERILP